MKPFSYPDIPLCRVYACIDKIQRPEFDLVCKKHWYMVPKANRELIYRLWRNGNNTALHHTVCRDAIQRLNLQNGAA